MKRSMLVLPAALAATTCGEADVDRWTDPSPHRVGFATVAPDVSLHYLDWGGVGEADKLFK